MQIPRFSTPIEDYCNAVRAVKTLADLKAIEEKYTLYLDDAREVFAAMNEESFQEFIAWLPNAYSDGAEVNQDWAEKYGAIVLPELFIRLTPFLSNSPMGSGFILNRLIDAGFAEIINNEFHLSEKLNGH